jgi:long-chain acyl-CoA synthetase
MTQWNNLGDLIDRSRDLERTAIIDLRDAAAPRNWSHKEIDLLAGGVARTLVDRGLRRGAFVGIVALNRAEYAAAYFGIMRAGYVAVPLNIKLPRETIDFIIDDARIEFAFVDRAGQALIGDRVPTINFDDPTPTGFAAAIRPATFETVKVGPEEIGQLLYTSGSSGRPKGVPLTHFGQAWALSTRTPDVSPDARFIIAQPLFHMNGLFSMKVAFAANASLVMLPGFDARAYIKALSRYKVSDLVAVPTMFARVVKEQDLIRSLPFTVKKISLASAPTTLALIERVREAFPQAAISLGYGTTEAGPAVFGPHPDGLPTPVLSIGYPLRSDQVKLVPNPNGGGEVLMMRNPAVMSGYRNLPDKSAEVLRDGWYYSGDVVRRDENGFYFFVGRADDMFVCSGENIYPVEVEKMLEGAPFVQQAAVVPLADEERGQMPVAFIVPREGAGTSYEEVKKFALAHAPAYQHPRRVKFVSELPLAGTNKIDRKALIEQARTLEAERGWSA